MVSYRWWVVCCSRPAAGALTCSPCFTHCYFRPPEHLYGAPPDAFSPTGQNWGFPTYNWEEMSKDNYKWWAWLCKFFIFATERPGMKDQIHTTPLWQRSSPFQL
eukprot:1160996-Pelagomonas_calceolata.AAC.11